MKKIQMVDTGSQYLKIQEEIDSAVLQVIKSCAYINGPAVKSFQKNLADFCGVKNVIPCANGTDALQIAMMALGLQPGDEVITSDFTYIATAEVIALLGLKPVLVDVYPDTFNIDIEAIRKKITPKTKVIVPVHLYGQSCDMEPLLKLAKEHNLFVVEDAAQAIGATYTFSDGNVKMVGTMGDVGCTSFYPSKNLGCYGDGGAMMTNNDELAAKLTMIANHGQNVRYYHDEVGVNSRLDTIQAAILDIKLKHLDEYNNSRRAAADFYDKKFASNPKIKTPFRDPKGKHVFHQYTIQVPAESRNDLQTFLASNDVPSMLYYPVPFHNQKAYVKYGFTHSDYPVTNHLTDVVISLPMHSELDNEQLEYITSKVLEFLK